MIIGVSILLNSMKISAKEIEKFKPTYLSGSKLSYGAITVGEKVPLLKNTGINIFQDSNLKSYKVDYFDAGASRCTTDLVQKNKNIYFKVGKELLKNSKMNLELIEKNKAFDFKKYFLIRNKQSMPSNDFITEIFYVGLNDEVVSYEFIKKYSYVPDHETMIQKLTEMFGESISISDDDPNELKMSFGYKGISHINSISNLVSILNNSYSDAVNYKGIRTVVTTNREENKIYYMSINIDKIINTHNEYVNNCKNGFIKIYTNLIETENKKNEEESKKFEL